MALALLLLFSPLLGGLGGSLLRGSSSLSAENLIICNEGIYQSNNGQLSFYNGATGVLTNQWFRKTNGTLLGDTPNDIVQINDTLIAIAVNWSNIIQFIRPDGTACGAIEEVPNNRRMCTDGQYLYVTSYAHQCGSRKFTKGFVAKIDVATKRVVAACEVGWEPEGVRLYKGRLYVANSGGYAYTESHDYETTLSVVDAATMTLQGTIDTKAKNLYGEMAQAGQYICFNAAGDYYDVAPKTVVVDCESGAVHTFDFPATCCTTDGKKFYTVGAQYSQYTGESSWHVNTIDPTTMTATAGVLADAITQKLLSLTNPYELYVSPYTGNVYFTDAQSYATSGDLYGYTPSGQRLFGPVEAYVNPAHILALKPADATGIARPRTTHTDGGPVYTLSGRRATAGHKGLVIKAGRKYIQR